jgi:pimeloyl-ACP methyl ester carboxylesterase
MKILLFLILVYGALVLFMYGAQTFLVFPGTKLPSRPLDQPFVPERLVLQTANGDELHGMLYKPAGKAADGLLIGFGGNAQDADELGQDLAARFKTLQVVVFHYRGYGPSEGRPSETALLADAVSIHDELSERLKPKTVFAYGISLGSGVAAYLATERPLDGAFLITPYDSIEAIAKASYPWLPVGWLLKHRFPSVDFLASSSTPIAIIAAGADEVIKPERTDALRAVIPNLVFDRTIAGAGHVDLYDMPAFDAALAAAHQAMKIAP